MLTTIHLLHYLYIITPRGLDSQAVVEDVGLVEARKGPHGSVRPRSSPHDEPLMYGFCYHFKNIRFNKSQHINEISAARVVDMLFQVRL